MRLEFLAGIDTPGAAYGDDTYGGNITYGQAASDDIGLGPFFAYPMPRGFPSPGAWEYRVNDARPGIRVVIASGATDEPINTAAIQTAWLVLDRYNGPEHQIVMPLTIGAELTHTPVPGEFDLPGIYRAVVQLEMKSGRQFTITFDDRLTMTVYPEVI